MSKYHLADMYTGQTSGKWDKDLLDAADKAFEAWMNWKEKHEPIIGSKKEPSVTYKEQQQPISKIFRLIWNCTDWYDYERGHGNDLADMVFHRGGRPPEGNGTYAAYARQVMSLMKKHET